MEDLLYEVESVRRFVGLRLTEALPDETTILNFRHLLEKHGLGEGLFEEINAHLASRGYRLRTGTIVDAITIRMIREGDMVGRDEGGGAAEGERHQAHLGEPAWSQRESAELTG